MKIHKLTYALFVLVFATLGLTFARQDQTQRDSAKEKEYSKQLQARRLRFPIAEYEEPDLADPKKNQARKEKKLRKNTYKIVGRNPPDWQTEGVASNEGEFDFPALPVVQSAYIVLGKVTSAEAHLSENKKTVYSEFGVSVEKVFKTASSSISVGSEIVVDRIGGSVKHPNGHTVLYRISGMSMPLTGERYIFFLTSTNHLDLSILTAYELGVNGVIPLDEWPHFEKYRGVSEESLVQSLRDSLAKSSPY